MNIIQYLCVIKDNSVSTNSTMFLFFKLVVILVMQFIQKYTTHISVNMLKAEHSARDKINELYGVQTEISIMFLSILTQNGKAQ